MLLLVLATSLPDIRPVRINALPSAPLVAYTCQILSELLHRVRSHVWQNSIRVVRYEECLLGLHNHDASSALYPVMSISKPPLQISGTHSHLLAIQTRLVRLKNNILLPGNVQ